MGYLNVSLVATLNREMNKRFVFDEKNQMRVIAWAVHLIFLIFVPCLCPQTFMLHAFKALRSHTKTARTVFFTRYPVFSFFFFFEYLFFGYILAPADVGLVVGKTSPLEKIHLSMFSIVITTSKNHLLL